MLFSLSAMIIVRVSLLILVLRAVLDADKKAWRSCRSD